MAHPRADRPENWLRFVQIDPFPRQWTKLGLDDDDLRALEASILTSPGRHPVIPETNGIRKLRFARPGSARGKRGGYRVFYVHLTEFGIVLLLAVIDKTAQSDLTRADRTGLALLVARIKRLLEEGTIR